MSETLGQKITIISTWLIGLSVMAAIAGLFWLVMVEPILGPQVDIEPSTPATAESRLIEAWTRYKREQDEAKAAFRKYHDILESYNDEEGESNG